MIGVLKYKWTFCAYEFSCFSQVPEESVVSSIVANWELTVLKEKALFCQTKNPKRSPLLETLHLCEVAKEHFFFPDENHSKLWRTSVCEVESMSRNWDSFIELGLRSCFSHKWCPFDGETFSDLFESYMEFVVPLSKQIIMHNACFSAVVLLIPPLPEEGCYNDKTFLQ